MKTLQHCAILIAFAACIQQTANANPTHGMNMNEAKQGVSVPQRQIKLTAKIISNFWKKVDRSNPDGCWPWIASLDELGYGHLGVDKKMCFAHRVSWVIHNGAIPESDGYHGTCVLHKCDNPACVNPAHLWLGTHQDNMNDREAKGRNKPQLGEAHGLAKLNKLQIQEIRRIYDAGGISQYALAVSYGIRQSHIWRIVHRVSWRHV